VHQGYNAVDIDRLKEAVDAIPESRLGSHPRESGGWLLSLFLTTSGDP
jgi:hypothetical protein